MMETPIACDLNAIPSEQREQHGALAERIFSAVDERKELPDGYTFRLPMSLWMDAAQFVTMERLCCPFFDFRLDLLHDGAVWLTLTGPDGVKELLRSDVRK